ncbi:hypothetical protein JQ543_29955 [Bradyrhizobium diazoefficiens]|nr:hypothetical protein [Bradyrhizobium diazoefficiens]
METTAYSPSGESRAFDFDQPASHPPATSYIRRRAMRADLPQDDPIPLFLSDPLGTPDPREYAVQTPRSRTSIMSRLAAVVAAISAAAIAAALLQSNLRSITTGAAPAQITVPANPPVAPQALLKDPARVTNAVLASAERQDLPAPSTPSREEIANAYQIALQAQAPPPAATQPAPPEPVRTLDADTLAGLMTRARSLISVGDIAAARLLLERAAHARDAAAALLLAQTYDPAVLGTSDARSVIADAAAARDWYERAAALGSTEARQRLDQLSN